MVRSPEDSLKATLARVAPGTQLRDGIKETYEWYLSHCARSGTRHA
jgi:DNA integrity scanning protein DisA with diadenylate cyclase activity